ncbi:hypothetical protein [Kitasatospora sp. MBT66]|uniref:hypothetical protein n=1 Tax=Kitasatospora sp. MBT66 TaxID=1444769 RepID=UPI0005BD25A3|nr:hypothetical protein [Kitasatospora sp. MBT66]
MTSENGPFDPKYWAWSFADLVGAGNPATRIGPVVNGRQEITFIVDAAARWQAAPLILRSVEVGAIVRAETYEPTGGVQVTAAYPVELLLRPPLDSVLVKADWILHGMPDPEELSDVEHPE